jgi:hypothetical protein
MAAVMAKLDKMASVMAKLDKMSSKMVTKDELKDELKDALAPIKKSLNKLVQVIPAANLPDPLPVVGGPDAVNNAISKGGKFTYTWVEIDGTYYAIGSAHCFFRKEYAKKIRDGDIFGLLPKKIATGSGGKFQVQSVGIMGKLCDLYDEKKEIKPGMDIVLIKVSGHPDQGGTQPVKLPKIVDESISDNTFAIVSQSLSGRIHSPFCFKHEDGYFVFPTWGSDVAKVSIEFLDPNCILYSSIADVQVHFTMVQAEEGNSGTLMFLHNKEYFGDSSTPIGILKGNKEQEGGKQGSLHNRQWCTPWKGLAAFTFYPVVEEVNEIELQDSIMRSSSQGIWEQEPQGKTDNVYGLVFRLGEGAEVHASRSSTDYSGASIPAGHGGVSDRARKRYFLQRFLGKKNK